MLNSYQLPVWLRVPGYKLYSWVFGVNLDECDPQDLREYRSMSEFFMRRLKDGARPIAGAQLVRFAGSYSVEDVADVATENRSPPPMARSSTSA